MTDYSKEMTEDLLDLLVSLGGIEIGLYDFEWESHKQKIRTIKDVIVSRIST